MQAIFSNSNIGAQELKMPNGETVTGFFVGDEFKRDIVKVDRILSLKLNCGHFVSFKEEQALSLIERGFVFCPECSLPKVKEMAAMEKA